MKSFVPVSLILLLLLSCKGVDDITLTGVDNVNFKGIENNTITFTASVGIHNPSSVSFRVTEVNLKTIVDGNFIGTLTTTTPLKIKAKSDSSYATDFSLEMVNLMSGASTLYSLSRKKQVNIEMQGFVKARSWFKTKKVPVSEKRVIDVPAISR
jgi:LEA14-like dessication related protein